MIRIAGTSLLAAATLICMAGLAVADDAPLKLVNPDAGAREARAVRTGAALLRTWIKDDITQSPSGDVLIPGNAMVLPNATTTVRCPTGARCMIELTENIGYIGVAGSKPAAAWAVDDNIVESSPFIVDMAAAAWGTFSWTFSRNVAAGTHTVKPAFGCANRTGAQNCTYVSHSIVIRLYKR